MDLVDDLGNDLALAILTENKYSKKIDSKQILPLMSKIREVLETVSAKDHTTLPIDSDSAETITSHSY